MSNYKSNLLRQEYKYYVSEESLKFLRSNLSLFMSLDENLDPETNSYTVSSLYFDTPFHNDFDEKVDGVRSREKYRLRIYNNSDKIIKFECKKRVETVIRKLSSSISKESSKNMINGDFSNLMSNDDIFLNKAYSKLTSSGYKAAVIVEYDREAFTLPYGNIRITFDKNLRTYNSCKDLFELKKNSYTPVYLDGVQILEVKFSLPLPEPISKIISKVAAPRCAISKFVMGQKYIESSQWQDKIDAPF